MVFRAKSKNIYWQEIESETIAPVVGCLKSLREEGWVFSSFTVDGRKGVLRAIEELFPGVPVQMCIFHQKAILKRYLTDNPKTLCGQKTKDMADKILLLGEPDFRQQLDELKREFKDFLAQKNEAGQFVHRSLRSALRSLTTHLPHLFTYQRHRELKIPTTTNSCDGSFAHWKYKVKLHRGLKKHRRSKMIHSLLKNS